MNATKPVHGTAKLRTINGEQVLTIATATGTRTYIVTRLDPDRLVAHPAFALENEDGEVWHVAQDEWGFRCDCPAAVYRHQGPCKHGRAIAALWENGILR